MKQVFTVLSIAFMFTMLAGPAYAAPLYYTFDGTVANVINRETGGANGTGGIDVTTLGWVVGDAVSYTFMIDFDAPGEHTQFDGDTFTISDVGYDDYFYAHLLTCVSSPTLPIYDDISVIPDADEFMNYGINFSGSDPYGWIYANSSYNEFFILNNITSTDRLVSEWEVGQSLSGVSRSTIVPGNPVWMNQLNLSLTLTSISEVAPVCKPIPAPAAMSLVSIGLLGLFGIRRKIS